MPINVIIVDDEKPARDELGFLAERLSGNQRNRPGKKRRGSARLIKGAFAGFGLSRRANAGLDGFGVLKKLVERKMKMPHVVFATAFDQYAVQAFEVNAGRLHPEAVRQVAHRQSHPARAQNDGRKPPRRSVSSNSSASSPRKTASAIPAVKVLISTQQRSCWWTPRT